MTARRLSLDSQTEGKVFENRLLHQAAAERISLVQIPTGCRVVGFEGGRPKLIPVKTPFDFVLAKNRRAIFFDAKSIADKNFQHSQITDHQVAKLFELEKQDVVAGYLVHFRQSSDVVFFRASELLSLKPRQSLTPLDGLSIGTINTLSLVTIFEWGLK